MAHFELAETITMPVTIWEPFKAGDNNETSSDNKASDTVTKND